MRAACLAEKQQNNYIVFDLTPPVLEPPFYRTLGEHAYHYNTDAASGWINILYTVFCKQNNKAIGLWKKNQMKIIMHRKEEVVHDLGGAP